MHKKEAKCRHRIGKHLLYNVESETTKSGYLIPFFKNFEKTKRGEDDCGLPV